ncbi:MAG: sodium-dependent transporter [Sphingomonadales bacterium]|nr:sodium-dependent transporter [Sphingomonadales bacterium]
MAGAHEQWSSRLAFIFAAVGSAVGLGNIWRFPYMAGENGGAAFVLVYIGFIAVVGLPVLIAELTVGRRGKLSPTNSIRKLSEESGSSSKWGWIGHLASLTGGLGLLSLYSVIAGWVLAYIIKTATATFVGVDAAGAQAMVGAYVGSPGTMVFWHFIFISLTVFVVARGINAGLEKVVTYLMPILFLLLLVLVGYAMAAGNFLEALSYLFTPDFSKINGTVLLNAIGQAFFSLSLGLGTMIAYGAYLPKSISIHRSAALIALADTGVALLAGLAIFPLVFAFGLSPSSGPTLIFEVLPIAFGQMPGGVVFGTMFFVLLGIAAITSSISMLEPAVSWFEEKQGITRVGAAIFGGTLAFVVGLLTVFSSNEWQSIIPLASLGVVEINGNPATYAEIISFIVSNLIMPVASLMLAIFVGWYVSRDHLRDELDLPEGGIFELWHVSIKYVAPVAIGVILVWGLMPQGEGLPVEEAAPVEISEEAQSTSDASEIQEISISSTE